MRRLRRALVLLAMAPGLGAASASAQTVVSDGDFGSWVEELAFGSTWSRPTAGGQPDAHLWLTGTTQFSSVLLRYGSAAWDSGVQGPLGTIRFSADVIGTSGGLAPGQPAFGFVLLQSGEAYFAPVAFDTADWASVETLALTATDFVNTVNPGQQPDFSASGPPIELAVAGSSNLDPAGFEFRVDNFEATLMAGAQPVPALDGLARLLLVSFLVGGGLLALGAARARTSRS